MAPAGRQAFPLSQRPTGSLAFALEQVTPVGSALPLPPQQSRSLRQISPVGRQPLGGSQIVTPGLYGAQDRLQQSPPHAGIPASAAATPPSAVTLAPHTWPATVQPVAPGAD